jgi:hypothetical protein
MAEKTVVAPPTDETPLEKNPYKNFNPTNHNENMVWDAFNTFSKTFGRNPTQSELDRLAPTFAQGHEGGASEIAQYYQNLSQTPTNVNKRENDKYLSQAPEHYDAVNEQFKSLIGRDATQAEKDHFGSLLASGQLDPYSLTQFLQAQPEYTQKQDTAFQESQRAGLENADTQYFQRTLLPAIQRQMLQSGRSLDSSGFSANLTQAASQQAQDREKYLTSLAASQYQGRTGQAYQDYANAQSQYYNTQNYNTQRQAQLSDASQARINELANFNMQKNAYEDYLKRYGKKSSGMGAGIGSLAGMAIGGLLAAPTGGMSIPMGAALGGMGGGAAVGIADYF